MVPLCKFPADNNTVSHIVSDMGSFHQLKPTRQKQLMVLVVIGSIVIKAIIFMSQFFSLIVEYVRKSNQGSVIPLDAVHRGNLPDHILCHKFLGAV